MKTAIVDIATGLVVNVIERGLPQRDEHSRERIEEATKPPEGFRWIEHDQAAPGWALVDGELRAPSIEPQPAPQIDKRQAAIDALLAEQAKRADAPQAVKDYAEAERLTSR